MNSTWINSKLCITGLMLGILAISAQASEWKLDPAGSQVGFLLQGLLPINAQFKTFSGTASYDPSNIKDLKISFSAVSDSLDAGLASYKLKNAENFAIEKFPTIAFKSTNVTASNATQGQVTGNLSMRGVTKPVSIEIVVNPAQSTDKLVSFTGKGKIKRSQWGMSGDLDLVADEVELVIQGKLVPAQ